MTVRFRGRLKLVPDRAGKHDTPRIGHPVSDTGCTNTVNRRSRGPTTVGIPGTGMSYHFLARTTPERPYAAQTNVIPHTPSTGARYCPSCDVLVLGKRGAVFAILGIFMPKAHRCPQCGGETRGICGNRVGHLPKP
jgi:hypothetical protein